MSNHLDIKIANSPAEAPNYRRDTVDVRGATIEQVVIVLKGTQSGKSTVDFVFKDQQGATYVAMLTGALVKNLAAAIEGAEKR